MAGATAAAINAALSLILLSAPEMQFRTDVIGLALIGVEPGQGANCVVPVKIDGRNTAGAHAEGDDIESGDFSTHVRKQATTSWAEYRALASVTGLAEAVAASGGYAGGGDLVVEEIRDAVEELAVKLGTHFYSGNHLATPPELAGAALAVDGSDDNFAGVDTGDYPSWKAGEATVASASLTIAWIRENLFRPVKNATGRNPEFVLTTGALMDQLKALIGANAEVVTVLTTTGGGKVEIAQDFGATAIRVDGVPFIEDRHCTSGTMYAFGQGAVRFRQLRKPLDADATPAEIQQAILQLTNMDIPVSQVEAMIKAMNGAAAIVPTIEVLGKTGDSRKFLVGVKGQLAWKRRNATAKAVIT